MNKQMVLKMMMAAGAFAPFRWANRGGALVLLYHRFGDRKDGVTVSPQVFERQVEYLKAHYQLVPLSTIAAGLEKRRSGTRPLAAITIDDGYQDFYQVAFPILRRHQVRATLFAVSDFIEQQTWMPTDCAIYLAQSASTGTYEINCLGQKLWVTLGDDATRPAAAECLNQLMRQMSKDQRVEMLHQLSRTFGVTIPVQPPAPFSALNVSEARFMRQEGIEIGSHSKTHPLLTTLTDEQLKSELEDSREQLRQAVGGPVIGFAYPHGSIDDRVRVAVRRAGYGYAAASEVGINSETSDLFALRRLQAEPDLPHFVQVTSGFEQVKNRLRKTKVGEWHSDFPFASGLQTLNSAIRIEQSK